MEQDQSNNIQKQLEQNYEDAANRLTQAKSAVEYQTSAWLTETDLKKKKEKERILQREKRALHYADQQYNQARKALGK